MLKEKEIIESIEEVFEERPYQNDLEGFEIKTNKQIIKVLISSGQQCCESFGYMISEDNPKEFIGAEINSISVTTSGTHNKKIIAEFKELDFDKKAVWDDGTVFFDFEYGDAEFVDIDTNKGIFQIAVYNSHNGYYGHDIVIYFNGKEHSQHGCL